MRFPTSHLRAYVLLSVVIGTNLGCERTEGKGSSAPAVASPSQSGDSQSGDSQPSDSEFRARIEELLQFTQHERKLRTDVHAAWQVIHGVLAFGRPYEILHENESVAALDWLFRGGNLNGWSLRKGNAGLKAVLEAGSFTGQGHEDQWLAVIAQSGLPVGQSIVVGSDEYTIGDLVAQAKHDVFEGKECSWTLIGLSTYVPLEATWTSGDGQTWSLERIVAMEAGPSDNLDRAHRAIMGDSCGGSHRMIGLTMALHKYLEATGQDQTDAPKLEGGWLAAQQRIEWAIENTRRNQQPDGSFSIEYFARPSNSSDLAAHLGATGHTLEFLSLALDDERLAEPWVTQGAVRLCQLIESTRDLDLECGALYHAAHALVLYHERRFGSVDSAHAAR